MISFFLSSFISFLSGISSPNVGMTPPGLKKMPVEGAKSMDHNTQQIHKGGTLILWSAGISEPPIDTRQEKQKNTGPVPLQDVKIADHAGNRK